MTPLETIRVAREGGMIPAEITDPQAMIIIAAGQEMGLQPLQSLRTMSFVRGRLTMTVQLQLALARQRAGVRVEQLEETQDGQAVTVTLARDGERVTCTYTMADARRAGLADQRNWRMYPRQMLRWRAIGDALRIIAPDVVMGLLDPDEASTLPPVDAEAWDAVLHRDNRTLRELADDDEARILRDSLRRLYTVAEMRQILANLGARCASDLTLGQARQLALVAEIAARRADIEAVDTDTEIAARRADIEAVDTDTEIDADTDDDTDAYDDIEWEDENGA